MRTVLRNQLLRNPILLATCVMLATGCKKCKPEPEPQITEPVVVQPVENKMAVVSIDPSRVAEATPFAATVRGNGFANGAKVMVGAATATNVVFLNSGQLKVDVPGLPLGRYDLTVTNPDGATSTLRGVVIVEAEVVSCDPATVYFDTNQSALMPDGTALLSARAPCYAKATATIAVMGHADERGTTEYNAALGMRRAEAAKSYLQGQGVPADRITTDSRGEESPADPGHDEAAWSKNRRAEVTPSR
jgi:outer membrane protein OmpA-like peptidoglycan-associated protein